MRMTCDIIKSISKNVLKAPNHQQCFTLDAIMFQEKVFLLFKKNLYFSFCKVDKQCKDNLQWHKCNIVQYILATLISIVYGHVFSLSTKYGFGFKCFWFISSVYLTAMKCFFCVAQMSSQIPNVP